MREDRTKGRIDAILLPFRAGPAANRPNADSLVTTPGVFQSSPNPKGVSPPARPSHPPAVQSAPKYSALRREWTPQELAVLENATLTAAQVATRLGISTSWARQVRNRMGCESYELRTRATRLTRPVSRVSASARLGDSGDFWSTPGMVRQLARGVCHIGDGGADGIDR